MGVGLTPEAGVVRIMERERQEQAALEQILAAPMAALVGEVA